MNTKICKTKIVCECGGSYTAKHKNQHVETQKHRNYIVKSILQTPPPPKSYFQTPEYIKSYRKIRQYNPFDVIHRKNDIIENAFDELGERARTLELGALMEYYDLFEDHIWKRRQELIDMRNKECLRQFLCSDIVERVFEYKK